MSDNSTQGPLTGVRVLDFTHVLSGPFATVLLADLGADVVKVEKPGRGDTPRGTPPYLHGISHYFVAVNHSKRGIGIDMQHAQGRELLLRLAAEADVVINNFRPGVLDEHGLSAETLSARNPRLIQCSISGFGQSGSYAQRASFDLITQAMTGVMSVTGEVGGSPLRCGLSIGDMVAGLYAVQAITTALYERERTGRGQVLDVSMFDCLFSFLSYYVTLPQATGKPPEPAGSMHASVVPMGAFRTQDGHIAVAAFNQRFWRGLCAAIGRPDLADDPRYASLRERQRHRDALMAELSALFAAHTSQHWSERLDAHDVPNGPVLDVLSLLDHPWVDERRLLRPVPTPDGDTVRVSRQPVVYGSEPPAVAPAAAAPALGQHTDAVLRQWLALPEVDILALRQNGAIT